jgi:tetratricopeptide (TPR) repeat protein
MQALKKAERAKQNSVSDEELDKPSEAFDDILALTPDPAAAPAEATPAAPPLAKRELSLDMDLEPMVEFSLEPMAPEPPAASLTPRPSPNPEPAHSDHQPPGLTLDLAPDPAAPAAPVTPPAPIAPPAPAAAPASARPANARPAAPAPTAAPAPAPAPAPSAAAGKPAAAQASAKAAAKSDAAGKPRGAARARAAAAATAEPTGMDPERMRLIGLIAMLVLILAGFGYYYWQAVMAPGAGSRLPPVPMPPPGATGATPVQVVAPGAGPAPAAVDADTQGIDPSANAMLAPTGRSANADLERRLSRTEQELAAAQQAIQAQLSAPRADRLPPVAAQDNGDIRVARAVQPSKVSPALDGAYQAVNSGDLTAAQQQYETALRQDGNSRDALLGLATLATRQNQGDKAASYYLRLLELDPTDSTATAGLIGLRQGDAGQSESRLKAALAANPEAAPVLFALGNLYAQQSRWSEAQQLYFRAYSAAPDNPDYAYNLAIGLDRLNQGKLAATYYQRALTLGQDKAVGFDRDALRRRMHELGAAAH